GMQLLAHGADLARERRRIAFALEDALADSLKGSAHARVARAVARARERLVLPHPGVSLLVALECLEGRHHQSGASARAQLQVRLEERPGGGAGGEPALQARGEARVDLGCLLVRIV